MSTSTIQLKEETKANLDLQRLFPKESYDMVIQRILKSHMDDDQLSPETIADMEEGMADIKAGRVYTSEQVKKELGL